MSRISNTLDSTLYFKKTFTYLKTNKWSWKYLIIPFFINFIISIILWVFLFNLIQGFVLGFSILSMIPAFFTGIISLIVVIISLLVTIYLFFLLANIISSPFNGLLTDKMLSKAGIQSESKVDFISLIIREVIRAIKFELMKLLLIIFLFLLGIIITAIPVLGVFIATIINFTGNTYLSLVDYFDPGLSYLGFNVSEKFRYVRRIIKQSWSFFLFSGFFMYIPLINIIYIPLAVVTANLVIIEKQKSE